MPEGNPIKTRMDKFRPKYKTADPELIRAINRYHVLDAIRQGGSISRVEIAERTALSRATISAITGAFIEEALIYAEHVKVANGSARGRPRVMLKLNPEAAYVVGVRIAAHQISIAVTDFKADVIQSLNMPIRPARQSLDVISDIIEDGVRDCVTNAGLSLRQISGIGIGIGIPGVIQEQAGSCRTGAFGDTAYKTLTDLLKQRLSVPVLVENDTSLLAMAEHWFGHGYDVDEFAVVTLEQGIGLGLFIGGEMHRGQAGLGPSLAQMRVSPGGAARLRRESSVDACASQTAILNAARKIGAVKSDDNFPTPHLMKKLSDAANQGDTDLAAIFASAGNVLGYAIANLISLLNPAKIILSGQGIHTSRILISALNDALEANTPAPLRNSTQVVFSGEGQDSESMWAQGAACTVLRQLYEAPWQTQG